MMKKHYSLTIFVVFSFAVCLAQSGNEVRIWEDTINLPTYKMNPADVNPRFFTRQSYQGASKVIYPYAMQDNLSNEKVMQTYKALYLENEYIKLCLLPELGGRLFYATDKTNNYEIFYRQQVIKPALIGMIGAWISGGIEFCVFHHHRASTFLPVNYSLVENKDGSKTIWIGEIEPRHRMKWNIGISLYPGKSYIKLDGMMVNRTEEVNSVLYWANVATSVNDNYQVIFPPSVSFATYHSKNSFTHWPVTTENYVGYDYYKNNIDASWWKNHPQAISFFAFDNKEGFIAGYDFGKNAGTLALGDPNIVTGSKLWEWGPGPQGSMWDTKVLTDSNGPYAELMVGAYSDNQPDYSWIKPYETKKFTQYWYPLKDIGRVKTSNLNAALNLELDGSKSVFFAANTSHLYTNARIILKNREEVVFEKIINIGPATPFKQSIKLKDAAPEADMKLILEDSEKNLIISYSPVVRETGKPLPESVKPPLSPQEIKTVEELYLTGLRIKQFHNARLDPNDYFMEALKRDSLDTRSNLEMGLYYKSLGLYDQAVQYFKTSLYRSTRDYTRPRNCEAFYNLGLVLQEQGKYAEAIDALYRASWDYPFHSASYYHLAQIASVRNDYSKALEYINTSLTSNADNLSAKEFKCMLLRKTGSISDAENYAKTILAGDPLNFPSVFELFLINYEKGMMNEADRAWQLFKTYLAGNPESYLELGVEYMNCGLTGEALLLLEKASGSDDIRVNSYPTIYYYLGYLNLKKGNSDKALEYFKKAKNLSTDYCFPFRLESIPVFTAAIESDKNDARAHYYLGNLLFDKQPANAISEWQKAVAIDPDFSIAYRNLGFAYDYFLKDYKKAAEFYEMAIKTDPSQPRYFYEIDMIYEKLGTPANVRLALLRKNEKTVSMREDALIREIMVLILNEKYDEAIGILQDRPFHVQEGRRSIHDLYVNALLLRGNALLRQKNYKLALLDFLKADEYPENHQAGRDPGFAQNSKIYYYTGLCYEKMGKKREADNYFKLAAGQQTVGTADLYYKIESQKKLDLNNEAEKLIELLMNLGRERLKISESTDFFAKFSEEDTKEQQMAECHLMIGLANLARGEKDLAKKEFNFALELDPNTMWAKVYLSDLSVK